MIFGKELALVRLYSGYINFNKYFIRESSLNHQLPLIFPRNFRQVW